ncbi:MAG: hypothetical protein LQ342_005191 [Letrouitia transgressa]|nr:MAG: hypothetical protein LQ342_005191 [Letrouitia transgressa]
MSSSPISPPSEHSAFTWIHEHILAYPDTYEIPLRTMYTLNSAPQAQPFPRHSTRPTTPSLTSSNASSLDSCPDSPEFPPEGQHHLLSHSATEHFKSCLMTHISHLPSQPFSLPPAFITSFVRRCFTTDLCLVDFTQALTALDYLKDLDSRRKRELSLALQRLGFDGESAQGSEDELSRKPRVAEWVLAMQEKERKVEALYTQVYLGLRRWTLINEMRLEPFNKANSIAMLNTLYPPTTANPPTMQLTSSVLASQRSAFFRYIQAVEKNGKGILSNLEAQGQRPNEANGWPAVRESVDKYLRTANGVIEECLQIAGPDSLDPSSADYRRNDRRADSGVSFGIGERPSTSSSNGSRTNSIANKPLPASPTAAQEGPPSSTLPASPKKRGTTLEKIARELRNFRSRSDPKGSTHSGNSEKIRTVKKMKSSSSIGVGRSSHTRTGSDGLRDQVLDIDDAKRERLILEARRQKESRARALGSTKTGHSELP